MSHVTGRSPLSSVCDAAYAGVPNWDVGCPQRAFVRLAEAGLIRGPVLDVGCGTGELSLFLARRGLDVLGVDVSKRAITQAREKARWRRVNAQFAVWDALDRRGLADAGFSFGTVVDCAMVHVLGDTERFVDGFDDVARPGGWYLVLGDVRADDRTAYGITSTEVRERFERAGGWEVVFAAETRFDRPWGATKAYVVCVRRQA